MKHTDQISVIDALLGAETFRHTQQQLTDCAIHWYYLPFTADPNDLTQIDQYAGSFSHLIIKDSEVISPLADLALNTLYAACDQTGQQVREVCRIRLGLCTRTPYEIQHAPHIDLAGDHRTGIYYPISSSGNTVVFDQRQPQSRLSDYTVWFQQQPTANLWFDFPGQHFHSSRTPTQHEERVVMTVNYRVK